MKKARSNTGCTIVRHRGKSHTLSQSVLEKWETPRGMVCSRKLLSLHEVRKEQYFAEDAREVWEPRVVGEGLQSQVEKMEKNASGRT